MNETVTVHYRFHPLAGTRATTLENRSHRGEPIVVVADSDGQRYHLPLWMTAPEAAQWGLRDRPRLSHSALSELRDLIAAWSAQPAPPATGDRDEISKATEAAEDADVRAAAPSQPAGGCETRGGGHSGGADCGGDGETPIESRTTEAEMSSGAALTAAHLERAAYVYIRQSSDVQVKTNVERQRLQYALSDHAKELGFHDIEVIDEDLGISGAGVHRPGFDALLEAVCKGRVGLVLAIEASRLSRNGREWHTLLDFCAIVGCLVGDRDRLYDPALIDDRMYLGLKGQFSEMELALFRQRSLESRMAMAQRGELFATLPAGYEKVDRNRIEMTADQRQRDAIHLVFRKFRELGSIRQVFFWFHRNTVELPVRTPGEGLVWRVPTSSRRVAQISDQPDLRWRLCLWPAPPGDGDRQWPQTRAARGLPSKTRRTGRSCFVTTTMATSPGTSSRGTRSCFQRT